MVGKDQSNDKQSCRQSDSLTSHGHQISKSVTEKLLTKEKKEPNQADITLGQKLNEMIITSSKSPKRNTHKCGYPPNMHDILPHAAFYCCHSHPFDMGECLSQLTQLSTTSLKQGIPPFVNESLFFVKQCPLPVLLFQDINSSERG